LGRTEGARASYHGLGVHEKRRAENPFRESNDPSTRRITSM